MNGYTLRPGRFFTVASECAVVYRKARVTLRRLWNEPVGPRGNQTYWPEVRRRIFHDELPASTQVSRVPATPEQIDQVDRVIAWASYFEPRNRQIYLARLQSVPWRIIGANERLTRQQCHNLLVACFHTIAEHEIGHLTKHPKKRLFFDTVAGSYTKKRADSGHLNNLNGQ